MLALYIDKNLASFWLIIQIRNWQCENEWWFVLDLWLNMDLFVKEEIKDSFYLITVFNSLLYCDRKLIHLSLVNCFVIPFSVLSKLELAAWTGCAIFRLQNHDLEACKAFQPMCILSLSRSHNLVYVLMWAVIMWIDICGYYRSWLQSLEGQDMAKHMGMPSW